jgi:hypothetical protein
LYIVRKTKLGSSFIIDFCPTSKLLLTKFFYLLHTSYYKGDDAFFYFQQLQ